LSKTCLSWGESNKKSEKRPADKAILKITVINVLVCLGLSEKSESFFLPIFRPSSLPKRALMPPESTKSNNIQAAGFTLITQSF
jgi:hypothetical protein